jgi:hypothetical protein
MGGKGMELRRDGRTRRSVMKKYLFFLALVFLLLTLSCGGGGSSSGGGSGGDSGTPAISNLVISPTKAALGQGGGAVTVNVSYDFVDSGGDLVSGTTFYYDKNGDTILSAPAPITGVTGKTFGHIIGHLVMPTTERGATNGGGYVTDAGGRQSNRLFASFTVF